jgi:hypothetical protein
MYALLLYVVPVIIAVAAVIVGVIGVRFYLQEIHEASGD